MRSGNGTRKDREQVSILEGAGKDSKAKYGPIERDEFPLIDTRPASDMFVG